LCLLGEKKRKQETKNKENGLDKTKKHCIIRAQTREKRRDREKTHND